MASLISIGLSGLSASQTALATTGNNIANVDTAGYSRQSVVQKSASAEFIGVGYVGNGTTVADVRRIYSEYLNTQLRTSTGLDAEAQTYLTQINQTDALLADSTTGISSVLSSFFEALQTAAENPTDASARALLLTNASGLAERFSSVYSQLADQNTYINSQLSSMAEQVNQLASSIANYNQAIVQASASGATPNDLLDARDQALVDLSELIGVTVVMEGNNANVFIGSGQPLVMGNTASTLTAEPSTTDPTRLNLMLTSGYSSVDVTSVVSGGSISGLVRYREEVLDPTLNELGRLALVIADQVNSQQPGHRSQWRFRDFAVQRYQQCACRIAEVWPKRATVRERQSFGIYRGFQQTQHQRLRSDLQQRYRLQRSAPFRRCGPGFL